MKNIRFRKLILLSYFEKKARIINLDADVILVRGANRTGKSCIIKSLYSTLGAEIKTTSKYWALSNVISLLSFTIDDIPFKAMHIGPDVIFYRGDGKEIFKVSRSCKESKELLSLLGVNVYSLKGNSGMLSPGALFMPFYIDQDDGWDEPWSSFTKVGSQSVKRNALLLHNGLIGDEYFIYKSQLDEAESKLRSLRIKSELQRSFRKDIESKFSDEQFPKDVDDFKTEIDEFIDKLQTLKTRQKEILKELQGYHSKLSYCNFKLEQLHNDAKEIDKDFGYALQQDEVISCPTCGAIYRNSLLNRHKLVEDISDCNDLIIKYKREKAEAENCIERVNGEIERVNELILNTQKIIDTKKNQYSLNDYIEAQKTLALKETLNSLSNQYKSEIVELEKKVISLSAKVKLSSDRDNCKDVMQTFRRFVTKSLWSMGSPINNEDIIRFGGKINMTGSILPKAVVAYYFAYFNIMKRYDCPIFCPIVIDEPHQKGLADTGYNKLLDYVINNRPENSQLILSVANDSSIDSINMLVVNMDIQGRVLYEEDYQQAKGIIEKLLSENFKLQ